MKRIVIIPITLMTFALTGCSLISNLISGGKKSEPKFENRGEEVSAEEYNTEFQAAIKDSKLYYDKDVHLESLTATLSAYMKQTTKTEDQGNKGNSVLEMDGDSTYKYNSKNLVANTSSKVNYKQTQKDAYTNGETTVTMKQDNTIQIEDHKLYNVNNTSKQYSVTDVPALLSDEQMMDNTIYSAMSDLFVVPSTYLNDETKYFVNGKIFTVAIEVSEEVTLKDYYDNAYGKREHIVTGNYQFNLKDGKYSMKFSIKETRNTRYTKDYGSYHEGQFEEYNAESFETVSVKFGSNNLKAQDISGYTKIS